MYIYVCIYIHTFIFIYIYIHIYINIHVCVYIYMSSHRPPASLVSSRWWRARRPLRSSMERRWGGTDSSVDTRPSHGWWSCR